MTTDEVGYSLTDLVYCPDEDDPMTDYLHGSNYLRKGVVLHTDSWYISECFVASGLPTVWIWDRANVGCHSWNPLTSLSFMRTSDGGTSNTVDWAVY